MQLSVERGTEPDFGNSHHSFRCMIIHIEPQQRARKCFSNAEASYSHEVNKAIKPPGQVRHSLELLKTMLIFVKSCISLYGKPQEISDSINELFESLHRVAGWDGYRDTRWAGTQIQVDYNIDLCKSEAEKETYEEALAGGEGR